MTTAARDTAPQSDQMDEVFGPQEIRPRNAILTETSRDDDDYCVSIATMPPGVVVPLHSHADRETFYILSSEIQGYDGDAGAWRTLPSSEKRKREGPANEGALCDVGLASDLRSLTSDDRHKALSVLKRSASYPTASPQQEMGA